MGVGARVGRCVFEGGAGSVVRDERENAWTSTEMSVVHWRWIPPFFWFWSFGLGLGCGGEQRH